MSQLLYYLILLPLSKLPTSVLHTVSTGIYYLLYRVIGYRTKVVYGNLERSFPEKSDKEIKAIADDFYRHFCDLIMESIRLFSMPLEEWRARSLATNPEILDPYFEQGRTLIVFEPHYGNWEVAGTCYPQYTRYDTVAFYAPLYNKFFDKIMCESRGRAGFQLVDKKEIKTFFNAKRERPVAIYFGGDQSPTSSKKSFWMDFLNQDTAMTFGTEKYAVEYDCPVFYAQVDRLKRGYYSITLKLVTDKPREEEHGYITRKNMQLLEKQIQEEPRYWLWTHRRWKRKRKE